MNEEIKAFRKNGKIIIEIPEDNLIFAIENSPHGSYKITDSDAYLEHFTAQLLEYCEGYDDNPMLFKVFDRINQYIVATEKMELNPPKNDE